MRLSAIFLLDLSSVNNYRESEHLEMSEGDSVTVYIQLRDASIQGTFEGYKNPGRRYVPIGGASSALSAASATLSLTATQPITALSTVTVAAITLTEGTDFDRGSTDRDSAIAIASAINADPTLASLVTAFVEAGTGGTEVRVVANAGGTAANAYATLTSATNATWSGVLMSGGVGATPTPNLQVTIDSMDDAQLPYLTKVAVQAFPTSDPSIWKFYILPTDPVKGTKRLKLRLVDSSGTYNGVVNSAILVTPVT